jgi:spermine oxidase
MCLYLAPIVLHTTDGSRYEADHVVVTVPVGVLKAEAQTIFNPPLPLKKQAAIRDIGIEMLLSLILLRNL